MLKMKNRKSAAPLCRKPANTGFGYVYQVITCEKDIPDYGKKRVYGIFAYSRKGLTKYADERDFCVICDISDNPEFVAEIAGILCENKVDPVHVRDIIEDMIS